jgi:methionyl-tRNA formyltransferase
MTLRLVFMGTPDFSVPTLLEIIGRGHEVAAVYTRAPKPGGRRGLELQETPVALAARAHNIPVHTPATLKTPEAEATFRAHEADVAVVVAYGLLLPKAVLEVPRLGCFNVHASLLPRWRGAAPINRAIMAGDKESGVGIMRMEEGLDTGPVALEARAPIGEDMTAGELHDELSRLGADLMVTALGAIERGTLTLTPQPTEGVTYAAKIDKNETRIDWTKPWKQVHDHCRGLSPFPGAWCELNGSRVRVLRTSKASGSGRPGTTLDDKLTIACGDGALRIVELQVAGKKAMKADEFLRGTPLPAGSVLN